MKDIVKISNKIENFSFKELVLASIAHLFVALAGIAASRAVVLDRLLPFGLSLLAGSSITFTPAAAIGVFLGYFFPVVGNGGFRYIASLFALVAIKLLLSNYKKIVSSPVFLTLISLLSNLITSAVALKSLETTPLDVATESLLCAMGTFFIARSFAIISRSPAGLSSDELATMLISLSILVLGLNNLQLNGISLGRILGVFLILTSAKYGGIISGAVSGIAVSLTVTLSNTSGNIGVALAFAGLLAGIFSSLGKYAQISVLVIFSFIGSVTTADTVLISQTVVEAALGSALFLTLPRKAGIVLGKIFSSQPKLSVPAGFKKSLTMRLELASNALKDVSETVEQVSTIQADGKI